jgi:hypothetical protein
MDTPLAGLLLILLLAAPVACLGQQVQDSANSTVTREEWRQRIDEARRRSEAFIADIRSHGLEPFSSQEMEREAAERAMRDPTLRYGDIVATEKGFKRFVGKDEKHLPEDFVPIPNAE